MSTLQDPNKLARMLHKINPQITLLRSWELKGGVSAQVVALEVKQPNGQIQKLVMRLHGDVDFHHNPQIAGDEFKLLQFLRTAGLPVPAPYHLDQSCEIFSRPYLLIEYIDGQTEFAPTYYSKFITQLAIQLAGIHQLDTIDLPFLPQKAQQYTETLSKRPVYLDESIDEGQIRTKLEAAQPFLQRNPSILLHGDFWPGNILWKNEHIAAIIDWEDAASGDPLADLANSRFELLWALGIETMLDFTQQYLSIATIDQTNLPYWDLYAALRPAFKISEWAANQAAEKIMREHHRWFINQAFQELSSQ